MLQIKMLALILIAICLGQTNFVISKIAETSPPRVSTPLGIVEGQWRKSFNGRRLAAFEGIRYAKPPVGDYRFEEAQPIEPWIGVWEASTLYHCIQYDSGSGRATGDEDCLFVNVYVPNVEYKEKHLDVVVHIHGGGFMMGHGAAFQNYSSVLDRDIIYVTFNYRLSALGFLSTEDEVVPGNNGMKDQSLALKWVQNNIASFGGNPDSVTIAGFSAGAAASHLHYFSERSKGLFHKGISTSGSVAPWVIKKNPLKYTRKLAEALGCPNDSSLRMINCFKSKPASIIIEKTNLLYDYSPFPVALFAPVVEKKSKNPFLAEHPSKMLLEGKIVSDVPWITSVTADDGLVYTSLMQNEISDVNKQWRKVAKFILEFPAGLSENYSEDIADKIWEYYIGKNTELTSENQHLLTKVLTNRYFFIAAEISAKLQSKITNSPVYFYHFGYNQGENSFSSLFKTNDKGVCHGDDLIYFLGAMAVNKYSEKDKKLKNICLDILYSYANTGVPTTKNINWNPTKGDELTFLNITQTGDFKLEKTSGLFPMQFWAETNLLKYDKESIFKEVKEEL